MKIIVISYSLTGNNDAVAKSLAAALGAKHIKVTETRSRNMATIVVDMLFNRTPKADPAPESIEKSDLVIFMGPVWMGQVATPLRAYLRYFKNWPGEYAFVSISGGSDGANPKLAGDLAKRLGGEPILIDMHIADLLPPNSRSDRNATMAYRLHDADVKYLTDAIVKTLEEKVESLDHKLSIY